MSKRAFLIPITIKTFNSLPKEVKSFISNIPVTHIDNFVNLQAKSMKTRTMLVACIYPKYYLDVFLECSKKKNQK